MASFPQVFRAALKRQKMTQKAFSELVQRSYMFVNMVARGVRGPPDDVDTWADALGLEGQEREDFLNLAAISLSPRRVQTLIAKLEQRIAKELDDSTPRYFSDDQQPKKSQVTDDSAGR